MAALVISLFWLLQGLWLTRFAWRSRIRYHRKAAVAQPKGLPLEEALVHPELKNPELNNPSEPEAHAEPGAEMKPTDEGLKDDFKG